MAKIISVHENIFSDNQKAADALRRCLASTGTYLLNVMSAPGSGKTTLLSALIPRLKECLNLAVMDVDIETDIDAARIAQATGVPSIQIHNGGLCHLDAEMTTEALAKSGLDLQGLDLLILENIGTWSAPPKFDTGAHKSIMLLSVPEGTTAPEYPLMFQSAT